MPDAYTYLPLSKLHWKLDIFEVFRIWRALCCVCIGVWCKMLLNWQHNCWKEYFRKWNGKFHNKAKEGADISSTESTSIEEIVLPSWLDLNFCKVLNRKFKKICQLKNRIHVTDCLVNNSRKKIQKCVCIPAGIRTRDLWIRSPTRYPLRYRDCYENCSPVMRFETDVQSRHLSKNSIRAFHHYKSRNMTEKALSPFFRLTKESIMI